MKGSTVSPSTPNESPSKRLICRVDTDPESGAFGVALVPFRSGQRSWRETFRAAAAAFGRHAVLASHLRASGWKLTAYTS
jgi:hypothetical protein